MFLHIGDDVVIPLSELIIILNLESAKKQEATREFFSFAQQESFVYQIGKKGNEKSAVITRKRLYYSPISSLTLLRRAQQAALEGTDCVLPE
ncbi:MAG: Uncharacterized protein XD63_0424 [Thermoanaerobacterales bacterium 50_218]|nr:MAG: Uncharacterized protein XD63_0424 [Thermoanaerobacterales bacterium 50_218]HAA89712.1 DUF370 domain-containing protein [Peptococcaceae bacterium]